MPLCFHRNRGAITSFSVSIATSTNAFLTSGSVSAAIKRNAGTGDSIDTVVITGEGFRELDEQEKTEAATYSPGRV